MISGDQAYTLVPVCTVYGLNLECSKLFRFIALLEGICATLNSCIQALNLYIHYCIDIYLKDIILALSWGARKLQKLNGCKKYQLNSIFYEPCHHSTTGLSWHGMHHSASVKCPYPWLWARYYKGGTYAAGG